MNTVKDCIFGAAFGTLLAWATIACLECSADVEYYTTEQKAAIINNCLDDNSALQCLGQYPEYADDEQLQEELAVQAAQCKANRAAYPDEYCEAESVADQDDAFIDRGVGK